MRALPIQQKPAFNVAQHEAAIYKKSGHRMCWKKRAQCRQCWVKTTAENGRWIVRPGFETGLHGRNPWGARLQVDGCRKGGIDFRTSAALFVAPSAIAAHPSITCTTNKKVVLADCARLLPYGATRP